MGALTLSIMGLYQYTDGDVFFNLHLPEGVDRETLINELIFELAELELLYPNADTMRFAIGNWSKKELPIWEKLLETTKYEYDPIENYDRKEEWTDEGQTTNKGTSKGKETVGRTSDTGSRNSGTADTSGNTGVADYVAGFNSSDVVVKTKQDSTNSQSSNYSDTGSTNTTSNENKDTTGETSDTGNSSSKHVGRMHGNIGVTTTQAMITEQRDVVKFNIYDYIINSFKQRFCLMVY